MNQVETEMHVKRLEKLKQATIVNYFQEVNVDSELDLYQKMLYHLIYGDFRDIYESSSLEGLTEKEKEDLIVLARKYSSLLFYEGIPSYWTDSVEGVSLRDLDLISIKLMDNYDYLLRLARNCGEDVLKQMLRFRDTTSYESSPIIEILRNSFENDDALESVLMEFSKENGEYRGLNDEQKAILCSYPEGVLFIVKKGNVQLIPPGELEKKIKMEYFGNDSISLSGFSFLGKIFKAAPDEFEHVISNIYYDSFQEEKKI